MKYTQQEVLQFVEEEDVKFIRLTFCDVYGKLKNISIMNGELKRAFEMGIAIDGSAIAGFGDEAHSDLFLHPDPDTLSILPWRPEQGRVVRMYCTITYPDGTPFEADSRRILKDAVAAAEAQGYTFRFGPEIEFYLFKLDAEGNVTGTPYDNAGYMDLAPADKGENIRREICLTLEQMGIYPESSHHEEGPGQNEIDFRYADPLTAADNAKTFMSVVGAICNRNGIDCSFLPKPIEGASGNGMHINISVQSSDGSNMTERAVAGILKHARAMTAFLNPTEGSYLRLGSHKAPRYVSWSHGNRSQLVRIPAATGEYQRAELRSPDPSANPYLAFALIIYAAIDGIKSHAKLPRPCNVNLYTADANVTEKYPTLPTSLEQAKQIAKASTFVKKALPSMIFDAYLD
jgi:glutamine synthetase